MYVDYKCTIWRRIHLPDGADTLKYFKKKFKGIAAAYEDLHATEDEFLYDTEEEVDLIDNDNQPTVELFDNYGDAIWDNTQGETKQQKTKEE